jgi:hypothetical protein
MQRSLLLHPGAPPLFAFFGLVLLVACSSAPKILTVPLLLLLSFHPALPPSHRFADAYSRLVCARWPELSMRSLEASSSPRCFVVKNAAKGKVSLAQYVLAWALLVQSLRQNKTVYVVAALPNVCNAPISRIWFQLCGFVDYQTMSVEKIKSKECFVLMFDAALAEEYFTAQYIVDCSVIRAASSAAAADSAQPDQDP